MDYYKWFARHQRLPLQHFVKTERETLNLNFILIFSHTRLLSHCRKNASVFLHLPEKQLDVSFNYGETVWVD